MSKDIKIVLTKSVINTLVRSAIEVYKKETSGQLWGRSNKDEELAVLNAYPFQTACRTPISVEMARGPALKKLEFLERAQKNNGSCTRLIGGFHSHTEGEFLPSKEDISVCLEELEKRKELGAWLEIIVNVVHRRYNRKVEPCEKVRKYSRTLTALERFEWDGYLVSMRPFHIFPDRTYQLSPVEVMAPFVQQRDLKHKS